MKKRISLLIIWIVILFMLKNSSEFSGILWGKGLFFAFWIPFVFLLKIPFQVSAIIGVFVFFLSSIIALLSVSQGERIVIYSWGLMFTALLQRYAQNK